MAIKTYVSINEFSEILENYSLGQFIEAKPINSGAVQTNYSLTTTESKLVFRYYENRLMNSVLFEADIIRKELEINNQGGLR